MTNTRLSFSLQKGEHIVKYFHKKMLKCLLTHLTHFYTDITFEQIVELFF